jgi:hypothetical protein
MYEEQQQHAKQKNQFSLENGNLEAEMNFYVIKTRTVFPYEY